MDLFYGPVGDQVEQVNKICFEFDFIAYKHQHTQI